MGLPAGGRFVMCAQRATPWVVGRALSLRSFGIQPLSYPLLLSIEPLIVIIETNGGYARKIVAVT